MNDIVIHKWSDIVSLIDISDDHKALYPCYFFRGQSDSSWELKASLSRVIDKSEKKAIYYESHALSVFSSKCHLYKTYNYKEPESKIEWFILMQHYSCPTRLLDWSNSPYVALYFAIRENLEKDGALFIINNTKLDNIQEELYPEIKNLKAHDILNYEKSDLILGIQNSFDNERTLIQQGVFTFSNNPLKSHCEIIDNIYKKANLESPILKLVIPSFLKLEFMARLKKMNITALTLFPGLDGLGKSVFEILQIRKWANE